MEALRFVCDDAIEYLNANAVGTRMYFEVDDNSLYLRADEPTEDEFDDFLDECYGDVDICGISYEASSALKAVDPIAYRCGFADFTSAAFDA